MTAAAAWYCLLALACLLGLESYLRALEGGWFEKAPPRKPGREKDGGWL